VNNQNFIMEDEQTGSWWQQITGVALNGPLAGEALEPMPYETVTFEVWSRENPDGHVLAPDPEYLDRYARPDWVSRMQARVPVPEELARARELGPRDLVVGVEIDGLARAYPLDRLAEQSPVTDRLGDVPLLLVVAPDGSSVRIFDRRLDDAALDLYVRPGTDPPVLVDAGSGSEFDFRGLGIGGPLAGRSLRRLNSITEFWFDWRHYHEDTSLYEAGR